MTDPVKRVVFRRQAERARRELRGLLKEALLVGLGVAAIEIAALLLFDISETAMAVFGPLFGILVGLLAAWIRTRGERP